MQDRDSFLEFFSSATRSDEVDQWTPSITKGYVQHLFEKPEAPTTMNRRLQTLHNVAKWIESKRPFAAGNPCSRLKSIATDEPEWKGLSDLEIIRLRSA